MTWEAYRHLAARAAAAGGRIVRDTEVTGVELKGRADYVTSVDRAAERAIRGLLEREAPDVPVVGEEEGGRAADRYWVVDPIDGTVNFIHRFPAVGVSVALVEGGRPVAGAVHAPFLAQTWTAARGAGAEKGGKPLRVSGAEPRNAVVGTGFPFRSKHRLEEYLAVMVPALRRFEDLRRPGAVALDLAWVAEGVFDGFFELGLSAWDVAAGALLIEEAGGVVTDWSGGEGYLAGDILAGPPEVHAELLALARG
ncbi:MAG TPA: inositol monophosphatase family protein [Actinomycetota bacterium]|nr:inositol monophosphatase family protein [Actinomycetota bacterium]